MPSYSTLHENASTMHYITRIELEHVLVATTVSQNVGGSAYSQYYTLELSDVKQCPVSEVHNISSHNLLLVVAFYAALLHRTLVNDEVLSECATYG